MTYMKHGGIRLDKNIKNTGKLNNSLDKALKLIDFFIKEEKPIGLSELSRMSGTPKATVYRILTTLEENGYLNRVDSGDDRGKYRLGFKFIEVGKIVSENMELRKIALPYMKELGQKTMENVQLIAPVGDEAIYIEKVESPHPVRLYTRVGRRVPFYGGACSRAILTFMRDEEIDNLLKAIELKKITPNTIIDKDKLLETIQQDRKNGYTISYGELEPDTVSIGAPIFNDHGEVIASVSIAGPEGRFQGERLKELISGIKDIATKISTVLGYRKC